MANGSSEGGLAATETFEARMGYRPGQDEYTHSDAEFVRQQVQGLGFGGRAMEAGKPFAHPSCDDLEG